MPDLHADQPSKRQRPDDPSPAQPDQVLALGRAGVDAFACRVASRTLTPPLAIGLFADWGSANSFFLRALQHRIDRLAGEQPLHRHIVQIELNAWQYVEATCGQPHRAPLRQPAHLVPRQRPPCSRSISGTGSSG